MAEILTPSQRFWAVDKVTLAYLALIGVLIVYSGSVPAAGALLAAHITGAALIVLAVKRPSRASLLFRYWYPLLYVALCYREMHLLIPAIRHTFADQWLARLDRTLWRENPTVWLERIQVPPLTEFLQIVYSLFVPAVLLVAWLLWRRGERERFRYYAFLIATGFLASYIGYLLVPAQGPRFELRALQHTPLRGLFFFNLLQSTLDILESVQYDCFPSGHTELSILAWWGSRQLSKRYARFYFLYTICIIFATVYLRYHYTVDIVAGALLALMLIIAMPALYRKLS